MRFVIQCVDHAEVETEKGVIGRIGKGFLVLAGICESDTRSTADRMVEKMLKLRIFEDENGKTNLNLAAVGGEILLVSQFLPQRKPPVLCQSRFSAACRGII